MFTVKLVNVLTYYLRGTTWTTEFDRANRFDSEEAALAALEKARKFMKPNLFRHAVVSRAHAA